MPKKASWGENSKAVDAKVRKNSARQAEQDKKVKAEEDAYWADDDKGLAKKQNRKEELEKKKLEKLQKKTESKQLAEEELNAFSVVQSKQAPAKITQAQINAEREKREASARKSSAAANQGPKPVPIVENLNRLEKPDEEATTVDEALKMLSVEDSSTGPVDKHPERRMKAAYAAFEESRIPILKAENPSLRLSQLKQMIFAEWQKSPENPRNQMS
jgi:hypothetical protein